MGIKQLYTVIKKECPDAITKINFSEISGYRVAIDISIFLYKHVKFSPSQWPVSFIRFLCSLRKYRIRAICIFDGKMMPIEKKTEETKRREQTQKYVDKSEECEAIRKELKKLPKDSVVMPLELSQRCESLMTQKRAKNQINFADSFEVSAALDVTIKKLDGYKEKIDDEKTKLAQKICDALGITYYQAEGEAEMLCCYLQINNLVDAVLTEDTDVLAYGCKVMLAPKELKGGNQVYRIDLNSILKGMSMEFKDFKDLCICLRCDYNKHNGSIYGYLPDSKTGKPTKIGTVGMVKMFKTYINFETVETHLVNPEDLDVENCREILSVPNKIKNISVRNFIQPPSKSKILKILQKKGLVIYDLDKLLDYWSPPQFIRE
ncbi:MAG TPA: hypothetical protein VLE02_02045 [Nitrosarchaeum sp.]|nr:hypothetical protein [Nitrosarchaeum sp.]